MARPSEETIVLGLGVLLIANPAYLSVVRDALGVGYVSSPIMTRAGVVYVAIGAVLLGFWYIGLEVTFRRATLATLGGVAVSLAFATTTGHGSFSASTYLTEVSFWLPRAGIVALLFPLGAADTRLQWGVVGGAMAVSSLGMFLDALFITSPDGFGGPVFASLYTIAFTVGALVVGWPLYYVGRLLGNRNLVGDTDPSDSPTR